MIPYLHDSCWALKAIPFPANSRNISLAALREWSFTSAISRALKDCGNSQLAIRKAAGRPVLIGIDQEGGTRFALREPFTAWPSAAELGRLGDAESVERVARAMATGAARRRMQSQFRSDAGPACESGKSRDKGSQLRL